MLRYQTTVEGSSDNNSDYESRGYYPDNWNIYAILHDLANTAYVNKMNSMKVEVFDNMTRTTIIKMEINPAK